MAIMRKGSMAAFVGAETLALGAANAWPQQAATILTTAGVMVTGILGLLALVDHYRINRRKEFDEANKVSLSEQLAVSLDNQTKMRESLHAMRDDAQRASFDNHELRDQLAELGKRLFETDTALNTASTQLREALRMLDESKADRESIRRELEQTRALAVLTEARLRNLEESSNPTWRDQAGLSEGRLDKLESGGKA